ncbi:MAG: hypothetical protein QOF01_5291 [Thermomicrobiales bacterium]|jgi:hypothetical protein|nr:hypothetical protein [Thermomicrobiales bacterium]
MEDAPLAVNLCEVKDLSSSVTLLRIHGRREREWIARVSW